MFYYFVYIATYFLNKVMAFSGMKGYALSLIMAICECAMFFLAGRDIITVRKKMSSDTPQDYQVPMCQRALALFGVYIALGIAFLNVVKHQGVYLAIRNILAINIVPACCGVLISLALVYLGAAWFLPSCKKSERTRLITIIVSVVGFLFAFIPAGMFGYALVGILIGGDNYGCVPIITHLFMVFWGAYTASEDQLNLKNRYNIMILIFLTGLSLCFAYFRLGSAFFLSAGGVGAFITVLFVSLLRPITGKIYSLLFRIKDALVRLFETLDRTGNHEAFSRKNLKMLFFYIPVYTILFLGTIVFIFLPIIKEGRSMVWTGDALAQYIPKMLRFYRYFPQLVDCLAHGNFDIPQYDFNLGLGTPINITLDPLYWLYAFLPKDNPDAVYTFMNVVRYYLAGLSFSALLLYFNCSYLATITGSLAYTFSGFALVAGTRHFLFISPLILLPLMVIAMERLIRYKKWYLFTILTGISLLVSYYFLYMNTIALGIYFISRIVCDKELRSLKTFFGRGILIVLTYTLGATMGVLSIATFFGSYLNSGRSHQSAPVDTGKVIKLFYRQGWISDIFLSMNSYTFSPGYWLRVGTIPLAIFGVVLLFTRKNRNELRLMYLIFTAFCCIPAAAYVFSGFSTVTNRWSYIYTALLCFLGTMCIDQLQQLFKKDILALTTVTLYYGLLVYFDARMQFMTMYADLAFLAVTLCVVLLINVKGFSFPPYAGKIMLAGVMIMSIIFNGSNLLDMKKKNGDRRINYTQFNAKEFISDTSLDELDKIPGYTDSKEYFRSTNLKGKNNTNCYSMVKGYNDVAVFSSTLTSSVVDYHRNMGSCNWSMVRINDYNGRTFMLEQAGVRFLGFNSSKHMKELPYGYKKVHTARKGRPIYENQYTLPVAYTYDTVLPVSSLEDKSPVEKQELTMHAAIIDDENIKACSNLKQTLKAPLLAHEVPCKIKYKGTHVEGKRLIIDKPGGFVKLTFKSDPNSETYVIYSGLIKKLDEGRPQIKRVKIKSGDTRYTYHFRLDAYKTDQDKHVFNLGYHKEPVTTCKLTFKKPGSIDFDSLSVYCQPMDKYAESVEARKEDTVSDLKIGNNTISGDITLKRDKMLVLAFPYQNGWTAYVDGKEVPIIRTNYQYMGLNLTPGTHKIRLHFAIPGFKIAFLVTGAGIGLFLLIVIFNHVRKRRGAKSGKENANG